MGVWFYGYVRMRCVCACACVRACVSNCVGCAWVCMCGCMLVLIVPPPVLAGLSAKLRDLEAQYGPLQQDIEAKVLGVACTFWPLLQVSGVVVWCGVVWCGVV